MGLQVVAYEFLVREGVRTRHVRLQGSGGLYGSGALHATGIAARRRVCARIVAQARAELEQAGYVREWRDVVNPAERIVKIKPEEIIAAVPVVEVRS